MNILETIKLLKPVNFNIYAFAGNANKANRQLLMSLLHDKKLPIAKCGITQLRHDLYQALNVSGPHERAKELDFIDKASRLIGNQP